MQPKLTKEGILNLSRRNVSLQGINSSETKHADEIYELEKATLLNERPWGFCLELSRDIQKTDQGKNLGYANKYKLPAKVIGVVALNPSTNYGSRIAAGRSLLRVGLTPGDDLPRSQIDSFSKFYFQNGVLHTDAEVNEVLVKIDPEEKDFTTEFLMCLSWRLAKYWAISIRGSGEYAGYAQREANDYHARAYRQLARQFPSIDEKQFYGWIGQYYGSLYR